MDFITNGITNALFGSMISSVNQKVDQALSALQHGGIGALFGLSILPIVFLTIFLFCLCSYGIVATFYAVITQSCLGCGGISCCFKSLKLIAMSKLIRIAMFILSLLGFVIGVIFYNSV